MRISSNKLNPILRTQIQKTLAQTFAEVKSGPEMHALLAKFLTESEYEGLAKRLAVAYWLKKGRSYTNIMNNLKVSSATIATVQTNINSPEMQKILKSLEADEWANQWSQRIQKLVKK